ncbi:SEL1-like repeat protein [Alsobacter sp. SYSU BS001988]
MKQAIPWSVKGVDANARDAAKDAARRAGMTLGEWLNTVIAETASEREERERREAAQSHAPAHPQARDFEGEERPAAHAPSPSRTRPAAPASRPAARYEDEAAAERLASLEARLERLSQRAGETALPRTAAKRQPAGERQDAYADRNDLASVLERAMQENRLRTEAVEEKTAGALDSIVRFMERSDTRRGEELNALAQAQERTSTALRDALGLVTNRMDSLERAIAHKGSTELEPIRAAILRLEERIERKTASATASPSRIEASIKQLESRLVDIADKLEETEHASSARDGDRGRGERIARIEEKLASVLDALDAQGGADRYDDDDAETLIPPAHTLDEAIAQIRSRQTRLEAPPQRRPREADRTAELLDGLRGDVVSLAERLERMDQPRDPPGVDAMRRELADLARTVQTISSRSDFASLERSVATLSDRVENWEAHQDGERHQGPAQRVLDDMRNLVEELRPVAGLTTLRDDIGGLAARLDRAPAQGMPAEVVEAILSQIADLRGVVAKAARPVSLEPLEKQVAALGHRLDIALAKPSRGSGQVGSAALADLSDAVAAIRSAMQDFNPQASFERLEQRLDELGQRFDREGDRGDFDDIRGRLSPIEGQLRSLGEKLDSFKGAPANRATLDALDRKMSALSEALDRKAAAPDMTPLETLVRTLGDKIDKVRSGAGDAPSLDALQGHLASMTAALERSGEGFSALRSMERSIGDLFAKIEDAKLGALAAADVAATKAANEAAARVMGSESSRSAPSEFAEVRTRQTLEAVHDTLEKIVERLGMLESDMASDRVRLMTVAEGAGRQQQARDPAPAAAPAQKLAAAAAAAEAARALGLQPQRQPARPAARAGDSERVHDAPAQSSGSATVMDLADDMLLEPGSGRPQGHGERVAPDFDRDDQAESPKASFIAAARKAAQAAHGAQPIREEPKSRFRLGGSDKTGKVKTAAASAQATLSAAPDGDAIGAAAGGGSAVDQVRAYVDAKRRPILIGLATILLAVSGAQVARNMLQGQEPSSPAPQQAPIDGTARNAEKQSQLAPPAAPQPARPAPESAAPAAPTMGSSLTAPTGVPAQTFAANPLAPGASFGARDPATVGSLAPAPKAGPADAKAPEAPAASLPTGAWPKALQKAASLNDPAAAFEIAVRLADGRGATRDPKLSAQWFEKAAGLGLAPAQYRLGSIYEKGVGVPKDLALAKTWYQRAAEAGNAKAMHNLGVLIAEGVGGKPDYSAAAQWFRKAAEFGVRDSQYNLAILTARGLGVQQNLPESWMWFSLAAAQGDQDAFKKRDEVAGRMDAAALAAGKAGLDAFRAKPQDAKANDVAAPAGGWDRDSAGEAPAKARSAKL